MNPQSTTNSLADRLHVFAEEAVVDTDIYVVGVDVRGRTGSRVVEVYVDRDEGIGVGDIAQTSRRLSFLLDTEDPIEGKYTLTVSSPGTNRSLALLRQYPRHIGREMRIVYTQDSEDVTVVGELDSVADDAISMAIPGLDQPTEIPFSAIREALVLLPW